MPLAPAFALKPVIDGYGDPITPVGAHVTEDGVVYRVWAPSHERVGVTVGAGNEPLRRVELERDANGFFSGVDREGRAGDMYRFEIRNERVPDPASRFQPLGVEGPSQVVDPRAYRWVTPGWRPPPLRGRVIYELHVGAFTPEGTFAAAIDRLDALVELGVNTIELMPLADFSGDRNWGYDGVMLFAPARCYGRPEDLRALVDAAHARGLSVVIDAVYNHLGPVGNVLPRFSDAYLHPTRESGWGRALNFDGPGSEPVREFFLQNVCMWFDEYRVDGLRLDALHAIVDTSPTHIIAEIAAAAHMRGGFVIGEDERNDALAITPRGDGGWGLDGVWADDFHHTLRVALTRQREAHFGSYEGSRDERLTTLRDGWFFQGQLFPQWERPRGTPCAHLPAERFVTCISNHDQVGNRPLGDRLHDVITPAAYRALSALLCLAPYTPMLFMGQEWAATAPFPYFTDHPGEIGEKIRCGRLNEYREKKAVYGDDVIARMPDPQAESTFLSAKLRWDERKHGAHAQILALYREALRIRGAHAVFQSAPRDEWEAGALGGDALAIRWRDPAGDWTLVFALGDAHLPPSPEFLRPRTGRRWRLVFSTEDSRFGGAGGAVEMVGSWGVPRFNGPAALLLREA